MAIDVSVQYNGGFLPGIILLTQAPIFVWFDRTVIVSYYYPFKYVLHSQGYYHRGTRFECHVEALSL